MEKEKELKEKPLILIVDVEEENTREFIKNHGLDYRIESIISDDIDFILDTLEDKYNDANKPDLIITGFSNQKDENGKRIMTKPNNDFIQAISKAQESLDADYRGTDILRRTRKIFGENVPICIYDRDTFAYEYNIPKIFKKIVDYDGILILMNYWNYNSISTKIKRLLKKCYNNQLEKKDSIEYPVVLNICSDKFFAVLFEESTDFRYEEIKNKDIDLTIDQLTKMKSSMCQPDIILIQLKKCNNPAVLMLSQVKNEYEKKVDENNIDISVDYQCLPILSAIREVFEYDILVAIYDEFGLLDMPDNIMEKINYFNADWFQKGLGIEYESKKINQLLKRS